MIKRKLKPTRKAVDAAIDANAPYGAEASKKLRGVEKRVKNEKPGNRT